MQLRDVLKASLQSEQKEVGGSWVRPGDAFRLLAGHQKQNMNAGSVLLLHRTLKPNRTPATASTSFRGTRLTAPSALESSTRGVRGESGPGPGPEQSVSSAADHSGPNWSVCCQTGVSVWLGCDDSVFDSHVMLTSRKQENRSERWINRTISIIVVLPD